MTKIAIVVDGKEVASIKATADEKVDMELAQDTLVRVIHSFAGHPPYWLTADQLMESCLEFGIPYKTHESCQVLIPNFLYAVRSFEDIDKWYVVCYAPFLQKFLCSCPSNYFKQTECKHVKKYKFNG